MLSGYVCVAAVGRRDILAETAIVLVMLAGGAAYDLRDHRIPNWWVLGSAAVGLLWLTWLDSWQDGVVWQVPAWFFIRALVTILAFVPLFHARMTGAGDVKLMAAICGFMGFVDGGGSILVSFLVGALLALVKMLVQRSLFQRLGYLFAYFKRFILTKEVVPYHIPARDGYSHTIPFGLCLFLGTVIYVAAIKN